jgi:DNA-directed RNA polymerase subunit E'/Rpb7
MEQTAIFEDKVSFSPKDMNKVGEQTIDSILLGHLKKKLEGKCSTHGFVIPESVQLLSRSMGQLENGRFTGNIIYYVQAQGNVYAPYNGMIVRGNVLKKNKMGLYIIYRDSIRILIPRDLHIGNELFESIQVAEEVEVELRKSRFQINDPFILSVGILKSRVDSTNPVQPVQPVQPAIEEEGTSDEESEEETEEVTEDVVEGAELPLEEESEGELEDESEGELEGELETNPQSKDKEPEYVSESEL